MAGFGSGEELWSDDDLDALPHHALLALENDAIQSTQHQTQAPLVRTAGSSDYGDEFEDDDLDDAVVFDEAKSTHGPLLHPASAVSQATLREQFRQERYGAPSKINLPSRQNAKSNAGSRLPAVPAPQASALPWASHESEQNLLDESEAADGGEATKKVQELTRRLEQLQQNFNAKAGENSIIRAKQEKASKEFERELAATKRANAERLTAVQRAFESAKEAEKTTATELEFAKRDLAEVAEQVRLLKRSKQKETPGGDVMVLTPKKNKNSVFRDGFDDDEIQISPSKLQGRRSNHGTPTKAGKRKRKTQESPMKALEILRDDPAPEAALQSRGQVLDDALVERLRRPDGRLQFLEVLFAHRYGTSKLSTMEQFAQYAFPSAPEVSFHARIMGTLPSMSTKSSVAELPIDFCDLLISLWAQCISEKFYTPVYLLIDHLTFAINLRTCAISPYIIDTLLPVAQITADLIAIPRFKRESYSQYVTDINVSKCLAIMHLAAQGCVGDKEHTVRFWRLVRLDFVLMMLSQHQPIQDFDMMLQLLAMSTLHDSLGPKAMDQDTQQDHAKYILDRMSLLLVSTPAVPEGLPKHTISVIAKLRLQILQTIYSFSLMPWGAEAVTKHSHTIGRLVKLMSDELDAVYDHRHGHKQSARLVCLAMRLIHYLVTSCEESINMQQKLAVVHGGNQKYLLCLARLNYFSGEDLVLDADIDPEVAECAHAMLELAVTPEEGDAIHSAFSSQ